MERLAMLKAAMERARQALAWCEGLGSGEYRRLCELDDDEATRKLAVEKLREAADSVEDAELRGIGEHTLRVPLLCGARIGRRCGER